MFHHSFHGKTFLQDTKSIAIICDDPDAPGGTFVHWVIFNIPANLKGLHENLT